MNEVLMIAVAAIFGMAIGGMFFAGLWWTIRFAMGSQHPELWMIGSLVVRVSFLLLSILWMGADDWRRFLACMIGILIARGIAMRCARPPRIVIHAA